MSFEKVDPFVDPERANAAVDAVLAPPTPLMAYPRPRDIELTSGWINPQDGQVYRNARVRELNGADEEFIARETLRQGLSGPVFADVVLRRAVEAIGPVEDVTPLILDSLLVGDRIQLVLEIRRQTFGDNWRIDGLICRLCMQPFNIIIELDKDIRYRPMKDPHQRTVEVELRGGRTALLRLVTGVMHKLALSDTKKSVPEQNTILIDQCLMSIDGIMVTEPMAQQMGMQDRKTLMDAINSSQPGPIMEEVSIPCENCGQEAMYTIGLADLFRD